MRIQSISDHNFKSLFDFTLDLAKFRVCSKSPFRENSATPKALHNTAQGRAAHPGKEARALLHFPFPPVPQRGSTRRPECRTPSGFGWDAMIETQGAPSATLGCVVQRLRRKGWLI